MKYTRVMIKMSGEVLGGAQGSGVDPEAVALFVQKIKELQEASCEVALVIGGGNFWRYRDHAGWSIPRESSDALGMMATLMNAKVLQEALVSQGVKALAMGVNSNSYFMEPYSPHQAKKAMEEGYVVICGGGTGNPYFTTDTTAVLRALELDCQVVLKATNVDAVYDKDPRKFSDAKPYKELSFTEALEKKLGVMDLTAMTLSRENALQVRVFNVETSESFLPLVKGEAVGTLLFE